jgi:hypothetical protein
MPRLKSFGIRCTIRSFSFGLMVFIAHDIKIVVDGGDRPVRDIKPVVHGGDRPVRSQLSRTTSQISTLLLMVPGSLFMVQHYSIEFAGTVLVKQIPAPCRTYQSSCQRCALPPRLGTQSWIQCQHPRCRSSQSGLAIP